MQPSSPPSRCDSNQELDSKPGAIHWLFAAVLTTIVSACQTEPEDPKGPQTYKAEFSITESYKIPTQVKWNSGNDSGVAPLATSGSDLYQVGISLASPPNSPINVDLYRAGIHYYRLKYEYNGSLSLKLNNESMVPNELAIELLKRLGDKATDTSAIAEVARSLVDNDTLIKSDLILAGKLPGLDTAKVVKEALKLLVAKNVPLKELVPSGKWILGIDTLSIHVRIHDLSLAGTIVVDTNKLFPPYPVRVKDTLAISGAIQAGGGAIAVSGIFEATNKLVTSSVKIFRENDDATTGFDFPVNFDLLSQPSKLDLSGKLSIAAKPTTAAGTYRLEIILQDQDAFFAKATLEFQVVARSTDTGSTPAKDTDKPRIVRQAGTHDSIVAYDASEVVVGWTVSDASPLKVTIQGALVAVKDGAYTATVVLDNATTVIRIKAIDSANNEATDSVIIRKGSEPGAPGVSRETGTKDTTVAYSVSSLKLSWKVTDASQVTLNGSPIQGIDGIYTIQTSSLKVGANGYKIVAKNAAGKESSDSITIWRTYHDSIFPVAVPENGTKDTTVPNATETIVLSWKVTDNDKLQSVTIGGLTATVAGDIYSASLPLKPGENIFELVASDTAKNSTKKSVTVIRTPDAGAPVIVRETGTKDSTVAYATTSIKLSWKVTDDGGVASVEINGAVATGTAGIYSIEAKSLVIGKNGFKIVAKNAAGKSSYDSVTITRAWKDTVAPEIARQTGTGPKTVAYEDSTYTPAWKVTDTLLKTVSIQGTVATGTAGVYSAPIQLALGRNLITITANDQATNTASDTFSIVRSLGTIPDLTISHAAGNHDSSLHVTIKSSVAGAVIKYTVDGTDPTTSSTAMTYSATVLIDRTRTLKAYATAPNRAPSSVATRIYTLLLPSPVPSRLGGTSADTVFSVDLSCSVSGAKIYYTLDGSTPTASSTYYFANSGIEIDSIRTLKAIAIMAGWTSSPVAELDYKANVPVKVFGASVIRADGSLWTLGSNSTLVDGSTGKTTDYTKVMDDVKDVTRSHILKNNGDLYAYGDNNDGKFGNGTTTSSDEPVFIKSGVKKVVDGWYYSLIIDKSDNLYAAGNNTDGNFCNGTTTSGSTYTKIRSGVADMATGYVSSYPRGTAWTLFVTTSGDAFSCGNGPLGTGTSQDSTPQLVGSGYSAAFTTDGGQFFSGGSLLLKPNGDAYSYSGATRYLISDPSLTGFEFVRSSIKTISGGDESILILDTFGSVWGAGQNVNGTLGDGTTESVSSPKVVMTDVKFITSSGNMSLFIKKNGTLWAAGKDLGLTPVRIRLP